MTNLIIDIGNSFVKAAFFDDKELLSVEVYENFTEESIKNLLDSCKINAVILSSVKKNNVNIIPVLSDDCFFVNLDYKTPIPIKNYYKTPETLGMDRLAAVVGASAFIPGKNVLVIDAGTCITYDLITYDKKYIGGSISPGLNMRFKALHNFTGKLPLLEITEIDYFCGTTTKESILAGVINGALAEVDESINRYKELYSGLKVVFCGGDLFFFDKKLKNRIFAFEKIVLYGLNEILKYNVHLHNQNK